MKKNIVLQCLLIGVVASVGAFANMTVDKSKGVLTITSDISGIVIAKIIGPNDEVVVNERYEGDSFSWTPSGMDGAYRYEVRVIVENGEENSQTHHLQGILEIGNNIFSKIEKKEQK